MTFYLKSLAEINLAEQPFERDSRTQDTSICLRSII